MLRPDCIRQGELPRRQCADPSSIVGTHDRAVSAVLLGTFAATALVGAPTVAQASETQDSHASDDALALDAERDGLDAETLAERRSELWSAFVAESDAEAAVVGGPAAIDEPVDSMSAAFEAGLREGQKQRSVAHVIGVAPGDLLVESGIPVVRNIGETLKSAGQAVSAPFTLVESLFTLDGEKAKGGVDDFARGLLGIIGLEHMIMGEYRDAGGGITGDVGLPQHYADSILEAKSEWRTYDSEERDRDYSRGMKKWHTLSNAKLTSRAGITELPWLFLGGIAHELDPGGVSAEIEGQGFVSWLWDSPLDVAANTMGMLGGLLLPDDAHKEYARVVGNLIPGPADPFEGGVEASASRSTDDDTDVTAGEGESFEGFDAFDSDDDD